MLPNSIVLKRKGTLHADTFTVLDGTFHYRTLLTTVASDHFAGALLLANLAF